jgi:hypothetical protein
MSLTSAQVEAVARQVYRQYPEVQGQKPSVQRQSAAAASKNGRTGGQSGGYVVTFKASRRTPDGRTLTRIVRATTDERGKVLKISTSK